MCAQYECAVQPDIFISYFPRRLPSAAAASVMYEHVFHCPDAVDATLLSLSSRARVANLWAPGLDLTTKMLVGRSALDSVQPLVSQCARMQL